MDKSINATYSWNKDSVSGDFSVGTKDGNSSTETKSFSELHVSIKHWAVLMVIMLQHLLMTLKVHPLI